MLVLAGAVVAGDSAQPGQADARPELSIVSMEHSFGTVKAGTPLNYSFVVKNKGKADLEITAVAPSCGCTTSSFDKVIAPGHQGKITLAIAKTEGYKGDVSKNATVTTNDPAHSGFQLTLKATFVE
jgi:hypothetical protein